MRWGQMARRGMVGVSKDEEGGAWSRSMSEEAMPGVSVRAAGGIGGGREEN